MHTKQDSSIVLSFMSLFNSYIPPQYNTVFGSIAIFDQAVCRRARRLFGKIYILRPAVPRVTQLKSKCAVVISRK